MDFEKRLQNAINRGKSRAEDLEREKRERQLNEEELKTLHSRYRLQLSEHIEQCIGALPNHFPGFRYETIYGERGWGAACARDDLNIKSGQRSNNYSRLEMTVRPFSDLHVLDLSAKGAIHNKEVFTRSHYERLTEADPERFIELIDLWVVEYAEMYAAAK